MMLEMLKALQEEALLTPVSTVITAALAFITVFINNLFIRWNVNKQLNTQVRQAQLELSTELHQTAQKEKREKLEKMHEYLHQYSSAFYDFKKDTNGITSDLASSEERTLKRIEKQIQQLSSMKLCRGKAEVLASAYSDLILNEFKQIKQFETQILDHLKYLWILEYEVLHANIASEKKLIKAQSTPKLTASYKEYDSAEKGLLSVIESIENLTVEEIKQSRKVENTLAIKL